MLLVPLSVTVYIDNIFSCYSKSGVGLRLFSPGLEGIKLYFLICGLDVLKLFFVNMGLEIVGLSFIKTGLDEMIQFL